MGNLLYLNNEEQTNLELRIVKEYEDGIIPFDLGWNIWISISLIICCIGFVGNGYIIWLLGFQIKRNRFTIFILHLAIADSGFLASIVIYKIHLFTYFLRSNILFLFCAFFSHMMYINANFILTAISIDRCVAVLFPIWHHCSRPKGLSSMVCVLLWISSFLLTGSIALFTNVFGKYNLFGLHFLVTAIVSLPLIILSTLVLFIKVCVKPKQKNQGRLLLMILITLLCFLILAFPLNVLVVILNFFSIQYGPDLRYWREGVLLLSCLNSSINPVIYFLVGRKKRAQTKESVKVILQKNSNPLTRPLQQK
uniref:G-protein coupled receptors family 1 profile domain-containing protein n=1 Tax=Pseudonaja textilis TaxID=8673 RepID=A0A670Z484_PSETE